MLTEKQEKNIKRGKKSRKSGAKFEIRVRKDLESKGWIVSKWMKTVEFHNEEDVHDLPFVVGKLITAKHKFNPFMRVMAIGTGFPDFIAFRFVKEEKEILSAKGTFTRYSIKETECIAKIKLLYEVIGVEVKSNGYLDKKEKEKCSWLLKNNIFSKFLVAKKIKKGRNVVVEYKEVKK